jgi:arginyl-tRNA synthetase
MNIVQILQHAVAQAVEQLYGEKTDPAKVQVNPTPSDFSGDYSVVIFPFVKVAKKAPDAAAAEIGALLQGQVPEIQAFNVIKGFLNLEISNTYWHQFLGSVLDNPDFGRQPRNGRKVMVEFSSPNTNKPLHLGHIRNILLGWSCSRILDAAGYDVVKVQIINDRGVAICKSMLAWQHWGGGKTPENSGVKGDHLVGDFYVMFENKMKEEYEAWQSTEAGTAIFEKLHKPEQAAKDFFKEYKNKWFNEYSALGAEIREMLLKWENHDPATLDLWKQMNGWVYSGFDQTYHDLGVSFDKLYYESNTYLLGKEIVDDGLAKNVFFRKEDGSVWIDLTDAGYDQKVLLRSDGTSVYITQDLGTARMRYHDFGCEKMVYVVADEQNYHFAVLFEILKRLEEPYAAGLHHLSYGLVELPTGRMKTREGTVVDADDLMEEVVRLASAGIAERGEVSGFSAEEKASVAHKIGLSALKYFMIKVNPKRKMIFNPEESLEFEGQTGPYIQYSYVRMNSVTAMIGKRGLSVGDPTGYSDLQGAEKELLKAIHDYPAVVDAAAREYDPSHVANYCYNLAKGYHRFWHDVTILDPDEATRSFRLRLSQGVGQVLKSGMELLGMEMPDRM